MITVTVMVNGKPIFTRSARNISRHYGDGPNKYKVDTGEEVEHDVNEGFAKLGIKLLETVRDEDL